MRKLTLLKVDPGYCRIYYRDPQSSLYCFQSSRGQAFQLLACTRDGEPSHEVSHRKVVDRLPDPTCRLTESFAAWFAGQEEVCL